MKTLLVDKKHAAAMLDFINDEVINGKKEIDGVISDNNLINSENVYLYECFKALNKNFSIEEIESKLSLWFPYGILISANDFTYEVVKKYTLYLSNKYNIFDKDLFFNPSLFFQKDNHGNLLNDIQLFFNSYKLKNNFIKELQLKLINKESIDIEMNAEKFLKTKIIINVTEKNKQLLEFLLDSDIFNGNSKIEYEGKSLYLLEYFLLRSLSCSQTLINKMMLQVNKKSLTEIKNNINLLDLSYFKNFKEEEENFKENMNLIDKKMIFLKFTEDERESSGSSSREFVKI